MRISHLQPVVVLRNVMKSRVGDIIHREANTHDYCNHGNDIQTGGTGRESSYNSYVDGNNGESNTDG